MPQAFVLTAALQLTPPTNINTIVSGIRKSINNISGNVNLRISPASTRNLAALNRNVVTLTTSLGHLQAAAFSAGATLNKLAPNVRTLANHANSLNSNAKSTASQLNNVAKSARNAGDSVEHFARSGANAIKRYSSFAVATTAVYSLINAMKSGFTEAVKFQSELVKISQVTGTPTKDLRGLEDEVTRLATTLGVSSEKLINVSQILAQAGLSAREVKIGLEALAKTELAATFIDVEKTVEGSIASMRQFNIGVEDLEKTLGSFNSVAGAFAVESDDIVTAVRRSGAAFSAAGGTLNEFIALFTSVRQTTRESAETIATGFRTIFTRIQRPQTIQFLKEIGIELADLDGKFVGPYEAVRRLSEGLADLDTRDVRFAQIVEELGGFRQVSKVIPLIQQFAVAERALGVAIRGETSLSKDAQVAQESFIVQLTKIREEFFALFRTIDNDSSMQAFGKLLLEISRNAIKLVESITPLIPLITTLGAVKIGGGILSVARGLFTKANTGGEILAGGGVRRYARGGFVPGTGNRDTQPALLQPGEFVLTKKAVESIGPENVARMNRYATGGKVFGGIGLDTIKKVPDVQTVDFNAKQIFGSGKIPPSLRGYKESVQLKLNSIFDNPAKTEALLGNINFKESMYGLINRFGSAISAKIGASKTKNINHIPNEASIIGGLFEGALKTIGQPYDERLDDNTLSSIERARLEQRRFDFPQGLSFGGFEGIPTEAKKTLNRGSINSIKKKILSEIQRGISPSLIQQVNDYRGAAKIVAKASTGDINALVKNIRESKTGRFDNLLLKNTGFTKVSDAIAALQASEFGGSFAISGVRNKKIVPVRGFADGGNVGTDSVPSLLTPGEFVVNKQSAQAIGYGTLNSLNKVRKYAKGGTVTQSGGIGIGLAGAALTIPLITNELESQFGELGKSIGSVTSQFLLVGSVLSGFGKSIVPFTNIKQNAIDNVKSGIPRGQARDVASIQKATNAITIGALGIAAVASVLNQRVIDEQRSRLGTGETQSEKDAVNKLVDAQRRQAGAQGFGAGAAIGAKIGAVGGSFFGPLGVAIGGGLGALAGAITGGVIGFTRDVKKLEEEAKRVQSLNYANKVIEQLTSLMKDIDNNRVGYKTGTRAVSNQLKNLLNIAPQNQEAFDALKNSGFETVQQRHINTLAEAKRNDFLMYTLNQNTGEAGNIRNSATLADTVRAEALVRLGRGASEQELAAMQEKIFKQIEKQIVTIRNGNDAAEKLLEAQLRSADELAKFNNVINGISSVLDDSSVKFDDLLNSFNGGKLSFGFSRLAESSSTAINGINYNERVSQREVLQNSLEKAFTKLSGNVLFGRSASNKVASIEFAQAVLPQVLKTLDIKRLEGKDNAVIMKELISSGIDSGIASQLAEVINLTANKRQEENKPKEEQAADLLNSINLPTEKGKLLELLPKLENHFQQLDAIIVKSLEIRAKENEFFKERLRLEQTLFETLAKFNKVDVTASDIGGFANQRRGIIAGIAGNGINLNDPNAIAAQINNLRGRANALRGADAADNFKEIRVLEDRANRLSLALQDLGSSTDVLNALQNDLAKAEEKRLARRQFTEDFAFAGKEGRKQIMEDVRNAFIVARNPGAIGTSEQEGSALRILKQFENARVFGGKTGREVIDERIAVAAEQIALLSGKSQQESEEIAKALINPSSEEEKLRNAITSQLQLMIDAQTNLASIESVQLQNLNATALQIEQNTQNNLGGKIGNLFKVLGLANGGKVQYLASGGKPKGTDTVPAMLTPGEFVVKRDSARKIGYKALEQINKRGAIYAANGGVVGYADGGVVATQGAFVNDKILKVLEEILKELRARNTGNNNVNAGNPIAKAGEILNEVQRPNGKRVPLTDEQKRANRQRSYAITRVQKFADDARADYAKNKNGVTWNDMFGPGFGADRAAADARKFTPDRARVQVANAKEAIQKRNDELQKKLRQNAIERPPISPLVPNWIRGREAIQGEQGGPMQTVNPKLDASDAKEAIKMLDSTLGKVPSDINLTGSIKPIEVVFNGAEVLSNLEPAVAKMVEAKFNEGIAVFAARDLQKDGVRPVFAQKETV